MVEHQDPALAELVAGTADDVWRFTEATGREQALTYARKWIRDADPDVREVGFMVLGRVALNHPPALEELLDHAEAGCSDVDLRVRVAVAQALGNQSGEQRCVPFLLRLLDDADVEVRQIAVGGLPIVLDDPTADDPAVTALVGLLADQEPTLRDWAAFALGSQLDVDSPQIRAGLRSLLSELDTDTAEACPAAEAAVGLARRADPEVFTTVADRLTRPDPTSLWLSAAAELADPRLLPALLRLRAPDNEPDDPWVEQLEHAIARCTAGPMDDDGTYQTSPRSR
ncbi:HEAT repeat domain-containing protein [Micromonospora purpureochromogenes]|uniref:HEAT repeat domain-containing protein n=1 Tax=Micromonospora purpureochromogenes TaxID=47872 RepID=UPI0033D6C8E8